MRMYFSFLLSSILLFLGSACTARQPEPQTQAQAEYRPNATIKDIMDSTIDPSADVLWDSFEVLISESGTEEKIPRTDEEWANVQHNAVTLAEATNLLLIPGRHVARPGEKADDPKVELAPEQIESMINQDRQSWTKLVHELNDVAMESLKAVEAKNLEAILVAGDKIDKACGNCHEKYWYPAEAEARRKREAEKLNHQP